MRRLLLLSMVFLAAVCGAAADGKKTYECYLKKEPNSTKDECDYCFVKKRQGKLMYGCRDEPGKTLCSAATFPIYNDTDCYCEGDLCNDAMVYGIADADMLPALPYGIGCYDTYNQYSRSGMSGCRFLCTVEVVDGKVVEWGCNPNATTICPEKKPTGNLTCSCIGNDCNTFWVTYDCHSSTKGELTKYKPATCDRCGVVVVGGNVVSRGCDSAVPPSPDCPDLLPSGDLTCGCSRRLCNDLQGPTDPPTAPTPVECYLSQEDKLGATMLCKGFCMMNFDFDRMTRRGCDHERLRPCETTLPQEHGPCTCDGNLCNNLIGPEKKCYTGCDGDCDFIDSANKGFSLLTMDVEPVREKSCGGGVRSMRMDTSEDQCYKTVYTFQSKSCTIYSCDVHVVVKQDESGIFNWENATGLPGNRTGYYDHSRYGNNQIAMFAEFTCTGPLCNTPASKVSTAGGTGLTLSLVGLMTALVAAYCT